MTFSGVEPLMQGEFLLKTIKLLKEEGINTALDTSGYGDDLYYKEILENVDVILLGVKHFDNKSYKSVTGKLMLGFYKFLSYLEDFHGILWLRHVMVPSITDDKESIESLFENVSHIVEKIDRFEILREEMGSYAWISRETMTRKLIYFAEIGLIKLEGKK